MKKIFKDFGLGVSTTFKGLSFAFDNKMAHFFLYPMVMTIIIAIVAVQGIELMTDWVENLLFGWFDMQPIEGDTWWDKTLAFLKSMAEYVISFLIHILCYYILHKTIKYIVLILMSPIMALISERTEKILTGNDYPFVFARFAKDVWRGVLLAVRNFVVEMSLIIAILLLDWVVSLVFPPLVFIVTPLAWLAMIAVGAYFWGFATMDYTNERRQMRLSESVRFIRANKGIAIGNGLIFSLLIGIPLIGTYIGPIFAIVMCTIGATLAIHKRVDLSKKDYFLIPESEKVAQGSIEQ